MNRHGFKLYFWNAPASGFLLVFALLLAPDALADLSQRDLQVLSRTLGFLDPPFSGTVKVGVVYDPEKTAGVINANEIMSILGNGLKVGTLNLLPVMVDIQQAGDANVDVLLLTAGNGSHAESLVSVVENRKIPCLTFDMEQVRVGNCMVGLQAQPKVEIVVNRSLAGKSGVSFASIFLMMIKEI